MFWNHPKENVELFLQLNKGMGGLLLGEFSFLCVCDLADNKPKTWTLGGSYSKCMWMDLGGGGTGGVFLPVT